MHSHWHRPFYILLFHIRCFGNYRTEPLEQQRREFAPRCTVTINLKLTCFAPSSTFCLFPESTTCDALFPP